MPFEKSGFVAACLLLAACGSDTSGGADTPLEKNSSNIVVLSTTLGDIGIELMPEEAPATVANFLQYVDDGFYDGTVFHRVVPGFVIQGGGFTEDLQRKPTRDPIVNEADNGIRNVRGTLSMARLSDANSATSQFFINLADNEILDHGVRDFGYAVFARVIEGMDVVDQIAAAPTTSLGGMREVPVRPVTIRKAQRR